MLDGKIDTETTTRKDTPNIVGEKIDDIAARLEKLEMKQTSPQHHGVGPLHSNWIPQHIIIGWDEGTTKEHMVTQAMDFLKNFEGHDKLTTPYSHARSVAS